MWHILNIDLDLPMQWCKKRTYLFRHNFHVRNYLLYYLAPRRFPISQDDHNNSNDHNNSKRTNPSSGETSKC